MHAREKICHLPPSELARGKTSAAPLAADSGLVALSVAGGDDCGGLLESLTSVPEVSTMEMELLFTYYSSHISNFMLNSCYGVHSWTLFVVPIAITKIDIQLHDT